MEYVGLLRSIDLQYEVILTHHEKISFCNRKYIRYAVTSIDRRCINLHATHRRDAAHAYPETIGRRYAAAAFSGVCVSSVKLHACTPQKDCSAIKYILVFR